METNYSNAVAGFTKLFSSIIHSTVWREDMHIKVVWVTMLAMANRNGCVFASVPGLAAAANVTVDQCLEALDSLASPDKWSRTKTYEGRRIRECEGGWELLNYLKYREARDDDERRIQTRLAVAQHRARKKAEALTVSNVSHGKPKQKQKQKQNKEKSTAATPLRTSSTWKRAIAIAHRVMDETLSESDRRERFKSLCGEQGIDYGQRNAAGRPLYARALEYVEEQRRRRVHGLQAATGR
jgi:hypothetical protein